LRLHPTETKSPCRLAAGAAFSTLFYTPLRFAASIFRTISSPLPKAPGVYHFSVEKEKTVSAGIVWVVEAQVKTSWGEYDSILDFIWCFKIDANTGGRVGSIEALSGA